MFKLALYSLISRKKWLLLIFFSFSIVIASTLSIFISSEAIKSDLKEQAYINYGEHSALLTGLPEDKETMKEKYMQVGEYKILGNLNVSNNKQVSVGWMDSDSIKMGHLKLLQGNFPKKENEVAIEKAYLELIDPQWHVGDFKKIQIQNKPVNVKLVGVLKNYSASWSVPVEIQKGVNDLPNIFISKNMKIGKTDSHNYLIKIANSKRKIEAESNELLTEYGSDATINNRMLYTGLCDYENISMLSFIFQGLILLFSVFCIYILITYYNKEHFKKVAILRAVGAANSDIYKLIFFQSTIIFFISLVGSILPALPLNYFIIKSSYENSSFHTMNFVFVISTIILYLIILYLILLLTFLKSIRKSSEFSINELLKEQSNSNRFNEILLENIKSFKIKQLVRQISFYPKQFILSCIVLSLCILLLVFSLFIGKESAGIWKADNTYYLNSQETFAFDTIENLPVLMQAGITFSKKDVQKIETMSGVLLVDKKPFMVDVTPVINPSLLTPPLNQWIDKNKEIDNDLTYNREQIIPNVQYIVIDAKEFQKITPKKYKYSDLLGKILLYVPTESKQNNEKLIGGNINLVKKYKTSEGLKTIEKKMEILDVINSPYVQKISKHNLLKSNIVTIVMDENTAISSGFFKGYNELNIYTKNHLSSNEYNKLDNQVNKLIAVTPGSLLQNIPKFIKNDAKIDEFVKVLGVISFLIASISTFISILVILFGKYQEQKKVWGIYLSLGMKKSQVTKYLLLELLICLILSVLISFIAFSVIVNSISHVFPYTLYLTYFIYASITLTVLLLIGIFILKPIVEKQSIFSLIKNTE